MTVDVTYQQHSVARLFQYSMFVIAAMIQLCSCSKTYV